MAQAVQTFGPSFRTNIDESKGTAHVEFDLQKKLGTGKYGAVWLVLYKKNPVAMKFFAQASSPGSKRYDIAIKEREMLNAVKGCSNVVQLLGWGVNIATDNFFVVMDFHTNIEDEALSLERIQKIARGFFKGMEHLERSGIIHQDIKPQNCLVNAEGEGVIADLGSALYSDEKKKEYRVTTVWYRDPRIFIKAPFDHTIDRWSMGCTLAQFALGKPLFPGRENTSATHSEFWQELHTMHLIVNFLGYPTKAFILKGEDYEEFFDDQAIALDALPSEYLHLTPAPDWNTLRNCKDPTGKLIVAFVDLIGKLVTYDEKISPTDALKSDFITRIAIT